MRGIFMKHLFLLLVLSLGDTSLLPASPGAMTDTVGTLNQVTEETDQKNTLDQQEQQEKDFKQDEEREAREWEESKKRSPEPEGRFDVPEA